MSKNLKNEYEELLDQEIPDLWSRIEPQLHEKTGTVNAAVTPEPAVTPKPVSVPKPTVKWTVSRIMRYSALAAACICLVIAIPAVLNSRRMNRNESAEDMTASGAGAMTDNAMEAESSEAAADAADTGSDEITDGAADMMAESAEVTDESPDEAFPESAESAEDASASENIENEGFDGEVSEEAALGEAASADEHEAAKGSLLELQVKVLRVRAEDTGGYSYLAENLQVMKEEAGTEAETGSSAADGIAEPEAGQQITIMQTAEYVSEEGNEDAAALQRNQTFLIRVRVQEDVYILQQMIKQY